MPTSKTALQKEAKYLAGYLRKHGYKAKVKPFKKKWSPYHWKVVYSMKTKKTQ